MWRPNSLHQQASFVRLIRGWRCFSDFKTPHTSENSPNQMLFPCLSMIHVYIYVYLCISMFIYVYLCISKLRRIQWKSLWLPKIIKNRWFTSDDKDAKPLQWKPVHRGVHGSEWFFTRLALKIKLWSTTIVLFWFLFLIAYSKLTQNIKSSIYQCTVPIKILTCQPICQFSFALPILSTKLNQSSIIIHLCMHLSIR